MSGAGRASFTAPALRAPLQCSAFAGSRRTRFAQTTAIPDPRKPARFGGAEALSHPAPHTGLRGGSMNCVRLDLGSNRRWLGIRLDGRLDVQPGVQPGAGLAVERRSFDHTHGGCSVLSGAYCVTQPLEPGRRCGVGLRLCGAEERSFRRKKGCACLSEASLRGPREKRAAEGSPKGRCSEAGTPRTACRADCPEEKRENQIRYTSRIVLPQHARPRRSPRRTGRPASRTLR